MISVGCLVVFALLALLIFNVMAFSLLTAKADQENLFTPNDWLIFRHDAHHTGESITKQRCQKFAKTKNCLPKYL